MRAILYFMLSLFGAFTVARAQAPSEPTLPERYLEVYVKIHDAENLEKNGDYAGSLKIFQECQARFNDIHQVNPDWESAIVGHRMNDVRVTIERLQKELAASSAKAPAPAASILIPNPTAPSAPPADVVPMTDAPPAKTKIVYPWHTAILTTLFCIDGKSSKNAWDLPVAKGGDDPDDRNGFASGKHASYFNPFYVALPFNDLTNPDKAKQYVPASWQRAPKDGKPVSACQGRWVAIKAEDGTGHMCFAQWEDVGPLRTDHAEYVFGAERPDTGNRAGISISPAVLDYLGLIDVAPEKRQIRWRFVDAMDVPPGQWLKLDEQAVIYTALHQTKDVGH